MEESFIFKVIVGGEGSVGKSSLIHRYVTGLFSENTKITIGVEHFSKWVKAQNMLVNLQLWDLAGQERFFGMHDCYVRGSVLGLIVYDLTRYCTVVALPKWVNLVRKDNPKMPIILIGSKFDLVNEATATQIKNDPIFKQFKATEHYLLSSKTGMNIDEVFQKVVDIITSKIKK